MANQVNLRALGQCFVVPDVTINGTANGIVAIGTTVGTCTFTAPDIGLWLCTYRFSTDMDFANPAVDARFVKNDGATSLDIDRQFINNICPMTGATILEVVNPNAVVRWIAGIAAYPNFNWAWTVRFTYLGSR